MIGDLEGLRAALGVAPAGKLAVLDALLAGDSRADGPVPADPVPVDDLVGVSGLPRRDVQEFTAALDLSAPGARAACRKLLAEYRASRAVVRPEDEAPLERAAAELIAGVPVPRKRFDHVQATAGTLVRRVKWLTERFDLSGRSVLLAGDHDLTSPLLARVVPDAELTVADIDEDLLAYIDASGVGDHGAGDHGAGRVRCAWADFRCGLPPALRQSADIVFTDPPYTPEGLGLFLSRCLLALSPRDPGGRIVVAYGHSRRRPDLGLAAQREIARHDLAVDAMLPGFSRYAGAQAVGSASDLYCLQPTAAAFRRAGGNRAGASRTGGSHMGHGIYTHGEHSVESGASSTADLIPLLARLTISGTSDPATVGIVAPDPSAPGSPSAPGAQGAARVSGAASAPGAAGVSGVAGVAGAVGGFAVAVGLGRLLADGVHPSVTGRAAEFVVDLRDDPGPWLLRAMLALNAPWAVFAVPRRHEAASRLTAGAGEWALPRAKFTSLSAVPVGDLVAVRCTLDRAPSDASAGADGDPASGDDQTVPSSPAGEPAADPGLALTRFVTRRAHGRLRNVWREGLIAIAAAQGASSATAPETTPSAAPGTTLTKRAAADLAEKFAADAPADPSLRLIDIPAAHFPALHRALAASAAAIG